MIAFKDGLIGIPPSSIDALSSYLLVTTQARADQMVAEFKSLNKTLSQVREFLVNPTEISQRNTSLEPFAAFAFVLEKLHGTSAELQQSARNVFRMFKLLEENNIKISHNLEILQDDLGAETDDFHQIYKEAIIFAGNKWY